MGLDRYLMLLFRQFHLEHIQSLAEALMTLTAGGCDGEREAERHCEMRESDGQQLIGK